MVSSTASSKEWLELLDIGIAVFDADYRLVQCNSAFRSMRDYPDEVCRPGVTLPELLCFNAERGDFGPGDPAAQVAERIAEIGQTQTREIEREMADGQILHIRYRRTGSGGLMVTFEDRTAERRGEAALKASEERYALVSEAAEEAIYEWDITGGRFYASPRLRALLGREWGEGGARAWDWDEIIHPDDRAHYHATLVRHRSGAEPRWNCEYRLQDADGAWRWVSDHGTSIRDAGGRAVRMVAAIRDITERVERDAALAESEERYAMVTEATADGIYDWDVANKRLWVSGQLSRELGFDARKEGSDGWFARVHPDDKDAYLAVTVAHLKGQTGTLDIKYRAWIGDGDAYRWMHDRGIGQRGPDGRVTRMVGAIRDITDIKEARAELDRTEGQLTSALATISDGILLVDAERRVQLWNERYLEIFTDAAGGADLSEVIVKGRPFFDMIRDGYNLGMFKPHPEGVDGWVAARIKAWDEPVSQWELELANGTWILLNERAAADGGRVSVYTDITELKRREQEAQSARQRFEDAIGSISSGFALFDAEDRLLIWNSRFRDYFARMADVFTPGRTFREMLAASVERGLFPAAEGNEESFLEELLAKRAEGIGKVRENRLADGLWLQIRDHRTSDGGLVSIYTDVTELKTSEQEAKEARERFEEAIEAISSGFALWNVEDRLVVCNSRFRDYFTGLADIVVPGTRFRDLIMAGIERGMFPDPEDPETVLDKILTARARTSGEPRERHLASGLWLHITDHRTKEGGIVSIYTDVTELKAREQEAQAARQRFEDAIESISSGFTLWDAEDRLVVSNSRYREYYRELADFLRPGATFEEVLRTAVERGLVPAAKEDPESYTRRNLETRAKARGELREHRLADGRVLQISDHRTADGGTATIHTDVTELKMREEEARAASKRFEEAIEAISSGFSLWDADDRLVVCNSRYRELYADLADAVKTGVAMGDLLMLAVTRGLLPDAEADPEAYVAESLRKRAAGIGEIREHRLSTGLWLQITDHRTVDGGMVSVHTDVTELKKKQAEIEAQSAILKATLENMGQGITMVDKNLRTVAFNRKFFELLEFPEERFGRGFTMEDAFRYNAERGEYGPGDVEQQVRERLELARKFLPHRFQRTRPDGTVIEIVGNPIEGGGLVATYTDITERKRAEQGLQAALAEFHAVLDNINYGVIFMGPDLRARIVNRAMKRMWNFTQELIDTRPTMRELMEFNRHSRIYDVAPEDWDAWAEARVEAVREGGMTPTELRRADGIILRYQCVDLADGGRMLTYFDITELKQAEQVVRDSEQRLRGILENSPIGVAVIRDEDNIIQFHNARFAEILHGPGRDLVGESSTQFWTDLEERKRAREQFEREGRVINREVQYRGLDGENVWSLSTYERAQWEGARSRLIWLFDITEDKANREALVVARDEAQAALADLQKAQARLIQAEKMASLGQLTAGIAHEIKNPLNFVNNFARLSDEMLEELAGILEAPIKALDAETRDDAEDLLATVRENLAKINQHGKRADSIVKNMLLHSREGPSEQQTVGLNAIAEEALNLAYHGARAEHPGFNIDMKKSLDPEVGTIECFPQDLMRVFLNLISNGMYAANKRLAEVGGVPPEIALTTRANGERVEIEVRDNGTGIAPEIRDKIFNPFFTTKPAGEGTGLGLSLSYDIVVKQHGGELTVESEPGAYTAFRITVPRSLPTS